MGLALETELSKASTLDFLHEAVLLDYPSIDDLVEAGIAHYHVTFLLRRLEQSQEIGVHGWDEFSRAAYIDLLQRKNTSIREIDRLPTEEKPRERALERGISALGDSELIALILRTGGEEGVLALARRLLSEYNGLIGIASCDIEALLRSHGLGPAKATELAAAFEIGRRLAKAGRGKRPVLDSPEAVFDLLGPEMAPLKHEELFLLPLDTRSRLIGSPLDVTKGDIDGTDAGPRVVFRNALQAGARSCIVVHNHPTGDPSPSADDIAVTKRLIAAGKLIDVSLNDHIIIGDTARYTSLRRTYPHLWT